MRPLERILPKCNSVIKTKDGYMALCPAHPDHNQSLSISEGTDGRVLLHCHAGCSLDDIVKELGVSKRDLFSLSDHVDKKSRIEDIYDYCNEEGILCYQVVRMFPKDFRMRKPDGRGGWIWSGPSEDEVVPYNLPSVQEALKKDETIYVVEGEKDCNTLISIGLVATSNHGGARKWYDTHSKRLKDADVVIIPDQDISGKDHAQKVARSLLGTAKTVRVVDLPGLPPKGKDISDWFAHGHSKEELLSLVKSTANFTDASKEKFAEKKENKWDLARRCFQRVGMPWHVLPASLSKSLKLLAQSCASDSEPLVGSALSIISSVIGGSAMVQIKEGWLQPLIVWVADIRPSGRGKTPGVERLMDPLYAAQKKEQERYNLEIKEWKSIPSDKRPEEPKPPRGYYITDLTVEGLRDDISGSSNGGILVYHSELSSLISTQDRYRSQGGGDREAWLTIWDGQSSRIVRAGRIIYVPTMRVSICGGVQSDIWRRVFGSKDGLYISDGTVYRILVTYYDGPSRELDDSVWGEEHRALWDEILSKAMLFADRRCCEPEWVPHSLKFSKDAYARFKEWRNDLMAIELDMPPQFRGYLPKAVSYAARLAGILFILHVIDKGRDLSDTNLSVEDVNRGIELVMYYLGQAVDAMMSLTGRGVEAALYDVTPQLLDLCKALENLCSKVTQGNIPIGDIADELKRVTTSEYKLSPRSLGTYLRSLGLDTTGRIRVGERAGVCALKYNYKVTKLINNVNDIITSTTLTEETGPHVDVNLATSPTSTSCFSVDVVDVCSTTSTHSEQPLEKTNRHVDVVDDNILSLSCIQVEPRNI